MHILVNNYEARLGNRLFAFSHLIAFSRTNHCVVRYPGFSEYGKFFKGTQNNVLCQYPPNNIGYNNDRLRRMIYAGYRIAVKLLNTFKMESSAFHRIVSADLPEFSFAENRNYDLQSKEFLALSRSKPVILMVGRFFRQYDTMQIHQNAIREFFTPIDLLAAEIDDFFTMAKRDIDVLVGVHRRGGDFREFAAGRYFYTETQYHRKLKEVEKLFPGKKIRFVICSDDSIDLAVYNDIEVLKGPGSAVADLYTLAKCDLIIGPPSTFSLWASFYGATPLCQMRAINDPITLDDFQILPKEQLYNYSFN